jgi:hypothetical protein
VNYYLYLEMQTYKNPLSKEGGNDKQLYIGFAVIDANRLALLAKKYIGEKHFEVIRIACHILDLAGSPGVQPGCIDLESM